MFNNDGYQPGRLIDEEDKPKKPVRYSPVVVAKLRGQPLPDASDRVERVRESITGYNPAKPAAKKSPPPRKSASKINDMTLTTSGRQPEGLLPIEAGARSTTNYKQFKYLPTNRPVDPRHVRKLAAAIKKKNLLHLNRILVNANMEVIDGQHRLEAAKLLKVPIYWTQDSGVTQEDIAGLNSNKKNWAMMDYIHFFAEQGSQAYIDFKDLCTEQPLFPPALLIKLCGKDGGAQRNALQTGSLDVSNMPAAEETIRQLKDISEHFELTYSARFIEAFAFIVGTGEYDHSRLMQRLEANPGILHACANKRQYIQMLQQVYNRGVREANIVIFLKR